MDSRWFVLTRVGLVLTRIGLVLTRAGLVLTRVDLCWYSCIKIDLILLCSLSLKIFCIAFGIFLDQWLEQKITCTFMHISFFDTHFSFALALILYTYMQWPFHDGDRYHIETSTSICSANQWTGFYMISAPVIKGLNKTRWNTKPANLPHITNP